MKTVTLEIPFRDPLAAFAPFGTQEGSILLDSPPGTTGEYAFFATNPHRILLTEGSETWTLDPSTGEKTLWEGHPLDLVTETLKMYEAARHPTLPPWQGGLAGYWSYDFGHFLEKLPKPALENHQTPAMILGLYPQVAAFDRKAQRAWIISHGLGGESDQELLAQAHAWHGLFGNTLPCPPSPGHSPLFTENFPSQQVYEQTISQVIEFIKAGDIFQANLTRRLETQLPSPLSPFDLYCHLRSLSPAPFATFMNFSQVTLASSSPERFLKLTDGQVSTYPIKGTRPRGKTSEEDKALAEELVHSEKDRAENLMIVDLMRNDVARVCQPGTVKVPELLALHSFANVHHLISCVTGQLEPGKGAVDLLKATFPGGSITGAPKIRAMEIIAALEPTARGPYCGSAGYLGFDGSMDTNILIRTYVIQEKRVTFQAGGAIVLDSDPTEEYEETNTKMTALKRALHPTG